MTESIDAKTQKTTIGIAITCVLSVQVQTAALGNVAFSKHHHIHSFSNLLLAVIG